MLRFSRTFSRWSTMRGEAGGGVGAGNKVPTSTAGANTKPGAEGSPGQGHQDLNTYQIPSALDRKYLVWSGQFKTPLEIPARVNSVTIAKARTWGRIRVNVLMMGLMLFGSLLMVYQGKSAMHRGENITEMNLEWHRKYNEEHRRNQEAAAAAKK